MFYAIDPYHLKYLRKKKTERFKKLAWYFLTLILVLVIIGIVHTISCNEKEEYPMLMLKSHKNVDDKCWKFMMYFKKKGSPTPEKMAEAVLATQSPRLMAAIATVETNGNPSKRNTGYRKRHCGAWQVNPKDWGPVSHEAIKQALQAEGALIAFVKMAKGSIVHGLNRYGGDSTDVYAGKVLAELVQVP